MVQLHMNPWAWAVLAQWELNIPRPNTSVSGNSVRNIAQRDCVQVLNITQQQPFHVKGDL